ncbi:MAG TPA: farnesyl diphosphate synthase [Terriglobia bacterium]|nr:farnesyl diphosphate synthase [Terriglobia bacterium]
MTTNEGAITDLPPLADPLSLLTILETERALVDRELDAILPSEDNYPTSIHRAMRYSIFAGGKRLRPILCLEAGRLFGAERPSLLRVAATLELIHTYSLIHDDLPAIDNDDLRRGKPTCHRAFGEATAILAGDALLTLAFENLAVSGAPGDAARLRVIRELARAIGTRDGMMAGEIVDLEATGRAVEASTLQYIHSAKTGAFITAAVRCGAIYASAAESDLTRLTTYGEKVGLAFQIADDLLDVLGSREKMGKAVGKDGHQQKPTYPGLYGVEESQRIAGRLIAEACEALAPYGERAQRLVGLAHFLITRQS